MRSGDGGGGGVQEVQQHDDEEPQQRGARADAARLSTMAGARSPAHIARVGF
jgi:hypothetical protein